MLENLQKEALLAQAQEKYRTNHILHVILSVLTVGLWVPIWLLVAASNAIERANIRRKFRD